MHSYRMSIPAAICVSVYAATPEDATRLASDFAKTYQDGLPVANTDDAYDVRCYPSDDPRGITIEDVEE